MEGDNYMPELKEQVSRHLTEVFQGETQETTARKLNTTQGNVSKWVSGSQVPTSDMLCEISKAYKVSVDWILGISSQKEIDGVVLEKLTYEQITRIVDALIQNNNFSIPNLAELTPNEIEYEEDENGESVPIPPVPQYDSDYIKVNDRLLSYLLRRRYKIQLTGEDMLDMWKENKLPNFMGLKLLKYDGSVEETIDTRSWSSFGDAEWVELIKELSALTEAELQEIIRKSKEKDGINNG